MLKILAISSLVIVSACNNTSVSQEPAECLDNQHCLPAGMDPEQEPFSAPPPPLESQRFGVSVDIFDPFTSNSFLPDTTGAESALFPEYKVPVQIPELDAWLVRISDNEVFDLSDGQAIHLYSKHQAWNADQTLIDVGNWVLDAKSFEPVAKISISTARNWSNLRPTIMYGIAYNRQDLTLNRFVEVDVLTDRISDIVVFSDYRDCTIGSQEGAQSADDRFVVFACTELATDSKILIAYDISEARVLGSLVAAENYNWVSISPSGRYILVENNRYPVDNPQLLRFTNAFEHPVVLGEPAHGDFGVDEFGQESYAMIDNHRFYYFRLDDATTHEIPLHPANYPIGNGHLSCRNTARPGWCYFSSNETGRVGALRIASTAPALEAWGYHYSTAASYSRMPKATVNRSGTQILITSDWLGQGQTTDYILSFNQPLL